MSSWQEVLWTLPNDMGWAWYALWGLIGGIAALLIFAVAIYGHSFSGMFLARVIFAVGLALIPLAALNSGWQPWIPAFYAISAIVGAMSMAVERCDREMEIVTVGSALVTKIKLALAIASRLGKRRT